MPDLNYFCIENIYNGDNSFCFASYTANATTNLEYSLDDGNTWTTYQMPTQDKAEGAWITIPSNGKCYFRGNNTSFNIGGTTYNYLKVANICNISGNIMSLLDKTCESTTISSNYCFCYLFKSLKVVDASHLILPATILAEHCYYRMFSDCTSLKLPPELPATILANSCYLAMFARCTSLTYLPALSANFLNDSCYKNMFYFIPIKFSKTPTAICKYRFRLPMIGYIHQDSSGCSSGIFGSDSKNGIEIDTDYYINLPVMPAYINYQINNLLYTTTAAIITQDTQEVVVTLFPIEGFSLPETISVIGADATYNQQTGQITITNLVGENISVSADGVGSKLSTPTISITNDRVYMPLDYKVDDYEIRFEEVV